MIQMIVSDGNQGLRYRYGTSVAIDRRGRA